MKVYLISGPARNGKDTIGNYLEEEYKKKGYKVCRSQISKYLKQYVKDYFGWDGNESDKPRKLLQDLGNSIRQNNPMFHINRLCEDIKVLSKYFDTFIVPDIRMVHEIEYLRKELFISSARAHA